MYRKMLLALIGGMAALALTTPQAHAGQVINATPGGTPAEVAFDSGIPATDPTIWNQLAGLISRALPGSYVGLAVHEFDRTNTTVLNALNVARNNGVHVYVVDDEYHEALDNAVEHYKYCPKACLSNNSNDSTIQHAKFATFSATKRRDGTIANNTTWISSGNLLPRTGNDAFNNAVVYYGSTQMYNGVVKVFQDMWNGPVVFESSPGAANADYFNPSIGRGYFHALDAASYGNVSPEQNSNLWKDRIAYVQTSASYPCTVRVMQAYLYDAVAAAELGRKKAAGCDVKVVVHRQDDGDPNLGASAKAELCADRVPIKGIKRLHDKVVISSSVYGSLGYTQQVITGSTNMTTPALRYNDELMLQISGAPTIYNAYLAHFNEANDNATTVSC